MIGGQAVRGIGRWAAGIAGLMLTGCGDRTGSEEAAVALADAVYPGTFELHDSYLQKGHYDVALAKKDDPLVRIRFAVDADPARCRIGTPCEQRLRRAHADAVAVAIRLKALNAAFGSCGVPLLGIHEATPPPAFRAIAELDMDPADQQPALDRLAPCIAAFRDALPAGADGAQRTLTLRILRPSGRPAAAAPLTVDSRLPDARSDEPSYQIGIGADQPGARAEDLRLYVYYIAHSGLDDRLAKVAREALAEDPAGGHVPNHPLNWQLKLDPQRLDAVRTYMLACASHDPGSGPCRTDIAVRMRYDLGTGDASEIAVIRDIRDARGSVSLPDLPGR